MAKYAYLGRSILANRPGMERTLWGSLTTGQGNVSKKAWSGIISHAMSVIHYSRETTT